MSGNKPISSAGIPADETLWQPTRRRGVTLVEVIVVVTILGILVSIAVPCYRRAIEQVRLDLAAVHLRTVWTAQRMYYLEHRVYAPDFNTLSANDLLDLAALAADTWYAYQMTVDGSNFTVTASRSGSLVYQGSLSIGPSGVVTGTVSKNAELPMSPGFQ